MNSIILVLVFSSLYKEVIPIFYKKKNQINKLKTNNFSYTQQRTEAIGHRDNPKYRDRRIKRISFGLLTCSRNLQKSKLVTAEAFPTSSLVNPDSGQFSFQELLLIFHSEDSRKDPLMALQREGKSSHCEICSHLFPQSYFPGGKTLLDFIPPIVRALRFQCPPVFLYH